MDEWRDHSGLFYHGTKEEVRLGDQVRMKRLFRRDVVGTVCYIPGMNPRHPEFEYADVKQWAIRSDDDAVYPILYDPDNFQPPKQIILLQRGSSNHLDPDEVLE